MSLCKACGQPLVFPTHLAQTEKAFVRPKRALVTYNFFRTFKNEYIQIEV